MPSRSDSSRSLTSRPSRSLTRLRRRRTWLQVLLVLGFLQVILGVLVVTFSLVAATITASSKIRHSCPSWAGFSVRWGLRGGSGRALKGFEGLWGGFEGFWGSLRGFGGALRGSEGL